MFFYFTIIPLIVVFASEMYVRSYAKETTIETPDYILLLGSGTQTDQPLLKERIQRAQFAQSQFPQTPILISGTSKEVSVMKSFFENVHLHEDAKRTYDSLSYIASIHPHANILIATNDFHMSRSLALAAAFKLKAAGVKEPQFYITSALHAFREVFGRLRCSWDLINLHKN